MIDSNGAPIHVGRGLIDRLGALAPPGRAFLVTDADVAAAGWASRAAAALDGRLAAVHVLPPGEGTKTLRGLETLLDALIEAGIERGDVVVAVGGGVVTDLAGLAAALVKRGCAFVPVPTSLLAQADAAIGGKTAVNMRQGKNLVGAFHDPAAIVIDIAALSTLPDRERRAGYAEIVKYALIGDADFFAWCEANAASLLAGDEAALLRAVRRAVEAKLSYVAGDERDRKGRRALLNFGHTFGHALETLSGGRDSHGEAVALGMAMAFRFSVRRGHCPSADAERVAAHLEAAGLPTRFGGDPDALLGAMAADKKRVGGALRLVLTEGIGRAFVADAVTPGALSDFLAAETR